MRQAAHPRIGIMSHLSSEALAGYLDDDLPREEQGQVELHLASCLACRDELAELRRLQRGRRLPWKLVLIPVAAAAAVMLAVALPRQGTGPSEVRARPNAEPALRIISPSPSAPVAAGTTRFAWGSAGPGASYSLTLQSQDGRVIWSSTTADTVAVLPDSVALTAGRTWFWVVDAMLPNGESRSTGINRLRTGQ
jgi:anti-sigma factor RsiW